MTQDSEQQDPFDDEELARAFDHIEEEFNNAATDATHDDMDELETGLSFEDELQGLLGNKAKAAMICTRLRDVDLLAAFCQIADISADCVHSEQGAVAVLHNLDGDGPEAAAIDLTKVVGGLSALLVVNRADKIEATIYTSGKAGEQLPPPFVFPTLARFVEDIMLGIGTMQEVRDEGITIIDSNSMNKDEAFDVIARHTHFDRGHGSIE